MSGFSRDESREWLIQVVNLTQLMIGQLECRSNRQGPIPSQPLPEPGREMTICHMLMAQSVLSSALATILYKEGANAGRRAEGFLDDSHVDAGIGADRVNGTAIERDPGVRATPPPVLSETVARGVEFIQNNYRNPLRLTDVARHAGVSVWQFDRLFVKELAVTFRRFVRELRLVHAATLLKTTNTSVKAVAFEVGYRAESSFCRDFKKQYGRSPSRFKSIESPFYNLSERTQLGSNE